MIAGFALGDRTIVTEHAGGVSDRVVIHRDPRPVRVAVARFTSRQGRSMVVGLVGQMTGRAARRDQRVIDTGSDPGIRPMTSTAVTAGQDMVARFACRNAAIVT